MASRRFFVERVHASGDLIELFGSDAHKIVHVLRMQSGDTIEVIDSAAHAFTARLEIEREHVRAQLGTVLETAAAMRLQVDVAQGLPKGQKMDFVVEKLTELGVATVFPLQSERAVVRDFGASKLERWRRLAKAAAQQCGRTDVPRISAVLEFGDLLARFGEYDYVLFAWEVVQKVSLRNVLPKALDGVSRLLLVIGPEGGFSHAEAEAAAASGAHLISLGPRILRTETAALVLLAIVNYALDAREPEKPGATS